MAPVTGSVFGGTRVEVACDGFFATGTGTISFSFAGILVQNLEILNDTAVAFETPSVFPVSGNITFPSCLEGNFDTLLFLETHAIQFI